MKNSLILFGILVVSLAGINSAVAQICNSYLGQTIKPMSYESVEKIVSKAPEGKGEFETTAAFEEKVAAFGSLLPESFLIGYDLHGYNPLKYDADNQQMEIGTYALTGSADYYGRHGYGMAQGYSDEAKSVSRSFALDIAVSETQKVTGSYKASNALGGSRNITMKTKEIKVIFERELKTNERMFVDHEDARYEPSGFSIPMSIKDAKVLKGHAKAAVLIVPASPYFDKDFGGTYPTFSSPVEVLEKYFVIISDIQCIFLLDGNSKVVSVFAVK